MQYTEIIKLLDAGYTREEILAMKDEPTPEDIIANIINTKRKKKGE